MRHKKRTIAALIILAIVCICGVELVACRYFAPALYQQITEPFRQGVEKIRVLFQRTASEVMVFLEDTLTPEETPVNQLASEPTIQPPLNNSTDTELINLDGHSVLTGGSPYIRYFNQNDPAWADQPYGSDHIGGYGCGPTAMAMAVSSMTDTEMNPVQMAKWAAEHGYWARRSGSHYSIVSGTAAAFGLQAESLSTQSPEAMREALLSGKILVALMGPGHFTTGGHFILIHAITLDGTVLVADPNSLDRSLLSWDPQLILDELSPVRSHGAPLWALSYTSLS